VRVDPLDLVWRRLSVEGEVTVAGPVAVEIKPSWIWDSPERNVDASGFAIAGNLVVYLDEKPMNGFWLKAHVGYERFEATLSHMSGMSDTKTVGSPIVGLIVGGSLVVSPKLGGGGFIVDGGLGFGVATADAVTLSAKGYDTIYNTTTTDELTFYGGYRRIAPIASMAMGVAF
jgi:hypothetical protein